MLALRLILLAGAGLLVFTLLGYALSRERRWLGYFVTVAKVLAALLLLLLLALAGERIVLIL